MKALKENKLSQANQMAYMPGTAQSATDVFYHNGLTVSNQPDLANLQRIVANPQFANPESILQLQRLYGNQAVMRMLKSAPTTKGSTKEATVQRALEEVKKMKDVYYKKSGTLTEQEGRKILARLSSRKKSAIEQIRSEFDTATVNKPDDEAFFTREWGLAKDRNSDEYVLIHAGAKEIEVGLYSDYVIFVAHLHPSSNDKTLYEGKTPEVEKLYKFSEATKPSGAWYRQRIFPSPADVKYCANNKLGTHTVFTPYYLTRPVAGPERGEEWDEKRLMVDTSLNYQDKGYKNTQRLNFDIVDAEEDAEKADTYHCILVAKSGDHEVKRWTKAQVSAYSPKGSNSNAPLKVID